MTFWLYVLFSILLKCNFSHINVGHYLVGKVPILSSIKLMTLSLHSSWYKQVPTHCLLLFATSAGDLLDSVKINRLHLMNHPIFPPNSPAIIILWNPMIVNTFPLCWPFLITTLLRIAANFHFYSISIPLPTSTPRKNFVCTHKILRHTFSPLPVHSAEK